MLFHSRAQEKTNIYILIPLGDLKRWKMRWKKVPSENYESVGIYKDLMRQVDAMSGIKKYPSRARYIDDAIRDKLEADRANLTTHELDRFFESLQTPTINE